MKTFQNIARSILAYITNKRRMRIVLASSTMVAQLIFLFSVFVFHGSPDSAFWKNTLEATTGSFIAGIVFNYLIYTDTSMKSVKGFGC